MDESHVLLEHTMLTALRDVALHIQYMRGHLPMPFRDILRVVQAPATDAASAAETKRFAAVARQVQELDQCLAAVADRDANEASSDVAEAMLMFGSNPVLAKDVYHCRLSRSHRAPGQRGSSVDVHDISTVAIRRLIAAPPQHWDARPLPPCPLLILLRLRRDSPPAAALWQPRIGLSVPSSSARRVVTDVAVGAGDAAQEQAGAPGQEAEDVIWYQAKAMLRPL